MLRMFKCVKVSAFGILALYFAAPHFARCQTLCSATSLSRVEAQQLLEAMPNAIAAKKQGANLDAIDWNPGKTWRHDLFYFFQLYALGKGDADNGSMGYFAVNKMTGRVVDGLLPDMTISGSELEQLQVSLRKKHCLSKAVIAKYQAVPPYLDN